ncbi:M24 family metallopeptidase [Rheinheimera maricola]|uniref:Xaa-Pro peptidase family protein n=1 Tax=Rheinheimera maricola TaxID=2793282 RepID=A0ABS7X8P6_9GAMM|nr:Xaa-Pro peptidase family protein [Rheinheimera maricola]MBZ9611918.1 Xaa-Pro peptidase family protein [Rheinheimera maricola]
MSKQIGGASAADALARLSDMTAGVVPITADEFSQRQANACQLMQQQQVDAMLLTAGTNLYYFTGLHWYASERLVAALLLADGSLHYVIPEFERGTIAPLLLLPGELHGWQEHESPYQLCVQLLQGKTVLALDESAAFFIADGLKTANPALQLTNAAGISAPCRRLKSAAELAIMQRAMDMTLAVHKATASMLYSGITVAEVEAFIDSAHRKVGAAEGSYFVIVLFGGDTAFPHGVAKPKALADGDMVLIDTGCRLHGYLSDITRSYVFGTPSARQREVWQHEKTAQAAAFAAAQLGVACQEVDRAARAYLTQQGYGPGYQLPGLPHRTGHGIGLDIHEWPYLVEGNQLPLAEGMCFSNEPMLVLPGEFGVRLEDHFYMTEQGPRWFTEPARAVDQPFS